MSGIVFLGCGGHAMACLDVAESAGLGVEGFLGPDPGKAIPGLVRLGPDSEIERLAEDGFRFLVAIGHLGAPGLRARLWSRVSGASAILRSSSASISARATVGSGTVVFHHCHVGPGAAIGSNSILNTGAIVEHDSTVGDNVHVSTRAVVNGGCAIGDGTLLGSGSIVLQGLAIAPGTVVGAGAVVTRNIDDGGTWIGIPARRIA